MNKAVLHVISVVCLGIEKAIGIFDKARGFSRPFPQMSTNLTPQRKCPFLSTPTNKSIVQTRKTTHNFVRIESEMFFLRTEI